MDSNVLEPHWLGTADGADRNSNSYARCQFLFNKPAGQRDLRRCQARFEDRFNILGYSPRVF